jgi:hypothetical protein
MRKERISEAKVGKFGRAAIVSRGESSLDLSCSSSVTSIVRAEERQGTNRQN